MDDRLDNFHSDFRIIAEYFVSKRRNTEYVPSAQEIKHVDEFLKLLQALTGDKRYYDILDSLQEKDKKEGLKMCEILDRVENKGIAIGEERGIAIGEERGIAIGEERGREEVNQLNAVLLEANRIDDLKRAVHDMEYQRRLMDEYGIGSE